MKQAILITDQIKNVKDFRSLIAGFSEDIEIVNESQININTNDWDHFISILVDNNIEKYLDNNEKSQLNVKLPNHRYFYLINFKQFEYFKQFVVHLGSIANFIIDNDNGFLFQKNEFSQINTYDDFVGR